MSVEVNELVLRLEDPNPEFRSWAARRLGAGSEIFTDATRASVMALKCPHPPVRYEAVLMLLGWAPTAAAAVQGLVASLTDPDSEVRCEAAYALGKVGPAAAAFTPAMAEAMAEAMAGLDAVARDRVVTTLAKSDPARWVVPALAGAIKDRQSCVRCEAAVALGKFGPTAAAAVPALTEALTGPDDNVRRFATSALQAIAGKG